MFFKKLKKNSQRPSDPSCTPPSCQQHQNPCAIEKPPPSSLTSPPPPPQPQAHPQPQTQLQLQQDAPPPYMQYQAPQRLEGPQPPRLLHVYYDHILSEDQSTQLYSFTKQQYQPPHLTLFTALPGPTSGQIIGTIDYRPYSSDITLVVNLRPITMFKSSQLPTSDHSFASSVQSSLGTLRWRNVSALGGVEMVLESSGGAIPPFSATGTGWLARWEASGFALTKLGRLQISAEADRLGPGFVDEVIVSMLGMVELKKRRIHSGTPGIGGGFRGGTGYGGMSSSSRAASRMGGMG